MVRRGTNIPKFDTAGWWLHGSTKIETARSPFYVLKYTGKEYQKVGRFPKGLRMFAVWMAEGVISPVARWFFRLSAVPAWLREEALKSISDVGAKFQRVAGGGWSFSGRMYFSPWEVVT
jgi:hypothetical protein